MNFMMMQILAEAATAAPSPPDTMISGNWITSLVVAVIMACGGIWLRSSGRKAGLKEATNNITIQDQPVSVRTHADPVYAYQDDLEDHIARIDKSFTEVWETIEGERTIARNGLGKIHARLDDQSKVTATLQGSVEEVGKNVGRLLDLALNRKPNPRQ